MEKFILNAKDEIQQLQQQIDDGYKTALSKAIRIGELLTEIKNQLPHGNFTAWIEANCSFSDRTARNYMNLHQKRDQLKSETVSVLDAYKEIRVEKKGDIEKWEAEYNEDLKRLNILVQQRDVAEQSKDIKSLEKIITEFEKLEYKVATRKNFNERRIRKMIAELK